MLACAVRVRVGGSEVKVVIDNGGPEVRSESPPRPPGPGPTTTRTRTR